MPEVSTFRLYLLRATYLLIAAGLGVQIWPGIIRHASDLPLMKGVVRSLLGGVSLLAALGIRYPLKLIPLLLFELIWKSIWLIAFALPLWSAHLVDPDTQESIKACFMGVVIVPIALPWGYVFENYMRMRRS